MAACYYLSGQAANNTMAPCDHGAILEGKHSNCCTEGHLCLSNGLCRNGNFGSKTNFYWRTGCTDRTFSDPACGRYCAHIQIVGKERRQLVWKCPAFQSYCCNTGEPLGLDQRVGNTNTSCCNDKDLVFSAAEPEFVATALFMSQSVPVRSSSASTTSARTDSTSSITSEQSRVPKPSTSLALPIGLGVGLGVTALTALLAVLLYFRQRKQPQKAELAHTAPVEIMDQEPSEMRAVERPVELTATHKARSN
ncbi:hypothetical protein GQ44DRAFT_432668 [Phaeosphaeriaceae sp. PMI808]|nr:hypothetical protein GQ44DRAFT_432668 [Phaeosphaeriaceae sp. PMI808]